MFRLLLLLGLLVASPALATDVVYYTANSVANIGSVTRTFRTPSGGYYTQTVMRMADRTVVRYNGAGGDAGGAWRGAAREVDFGYYGEVLYHRYHPERGLLKYCEPRSWIPWEGLVGRTPKHKRRCKIAMHAGQRTEIPADVPDGPVLIREVRQKWTPVQTKAGTVYVPASR